MPDYKDMIAIRGDLFEFDSAREYLIDHTNPNNYQRIANLAHGREHVIALYHDKKRRFAVHAVTNSWLGTGYSRIRIPRLIIEKGDQLPDTEIESYNSESLEKKKGYQYITEKLSGRLNGILPERQIAGLQYVIDINNMQIFQSDCPQNRFVFPQRALFESSEHLFDSREMKPIPFDPKINEYPRDVICIVFPRLSQLDIVGYSIKNGLSPSAMICEFPWNPNDVALQVKRLEETNIPELVRRNQIEQELQNSPKPVSLNCKNNQRGEKRKRMNR
ncbi:hypothetical protein PV783_24940 [Chitinophaga sp. CC14]|uniref:hypothetical protein n=1 Tax=Chitinophaga sp. CC14 TaxID=3029199 RepID=UPI003B795B2B